MSDEQIAALDIPGLIELIKKLLDELMLRFMEAAKE